MREDIIFGWNKKIKNVKAADLNHFLFITSLCIDKIIENDTSAQSWLNKEKILCYFDDTKMNGLLFDLINPDVFALSIQNLMNDDKFYNYYYIYMYNHYGGKLYNEIVEYDLKLIKPASICNVKFTAFSKV